MARVTTDLWLHIAGHHSNSHFLHYM